MGYGQQSRFRFDLSTARVGNGEAIRATGKKIAVTGASGISANAEVSIMQDGQSPYYEMIDQAYLYDGQGFEGFFLTNTAQAGAWIEITISDQKEDFEYYKPNTANINEIAEPVKTRGGATGAQGAVAVGTVATVILAANANRTGWAVHNNGANTIFIGGAGVTTANGMPIAVGEKYGEDGTDAIYGIVAAATEEIRYREVSE